MSKQQSLLTEWRSDLYRKRLGWVCILLGFVLCRSLKRADLTSSSCLLSRNNGRHELGDGFDLPVWTCGPASALTGYSIQGSPSQEGDYRPRKSLIPFAHRLTHNEEAHNRRTELVVNPYQHMTLNSYIHSIWQWRDERPPVGCVYTRITVPSFLVPPTHNKVLRIYNLQIERIKQEVRQAKEILRWNWWSHILGHPQLLTMAMALSFKASTILQHDLVMQGSNTARRKECCTVAVAWKERLKIPKEFPDLLRPWVGIDRSPYEKWFEWIDIVVDVRR